MPFDSLQSIHPKIVYSPGYDIRFLGLENLHPFDSCKYSRTWRELLAQFSRPSESNLRNPLLSHHLQPESPATVAELRQVHSPAYLEKLQKSAQVAQVLELPELGLLPQFVLEQCVLKPMRLAVRGTIQAAEAAIDHGIAINLSGGYHHASSDRGEGFCVYSDIAIAIAHLRQRGRLTPQDQILIIDLDAHQGNGLARIFGKDDRVLIFDMFNQDIYPQDRQAQAWIDYGLPLASKTKDAQYLDLLTQHLPLFLSRIEQPRLAFYNAGTDIFESDPLGGLKISSEGVFARDQFVFSALSTAQIPWAMVLSGGYTRESYRLIARSVAAVLTTWGGELDSLEKESYI